jgi:hypothetical protein
LEITRRSDCNSFTISLQNETHSSDSAAIEEDGRVEQFTYSPVSWGLPGFGIRINALRWFSIGDLSFVLFCEEGTEQNIEHEAAEGCKNNSGKLEADAVEVG